MRQASTITGGSRGQEGKRAGLWQRQLSKGTEWERKLNFRAGQLLQPCGATVQVHGWPCAWPADETVARELLFCSFLIKLAEAPLQYRPPSPHCTYKLCSLFYEYELSSQHSPKNVNSTFTVLRRPVRTVQGNRFCCNKNHPVRREIRIHLKVCEWVGSLELGPVGTMSMIMKWEQLVVITKLVWVGEKERGRSSRQNKGAL